VGEVVVAEPERVQVGGRRLHAARDRVAAAERRGPEVEVEHPVVRRAPRAPQPVGHGELVQVGEQRAGDQLGGIRGRGRGGGIGRVTAREAAGRGAKVVLVSRDEVDLRQLAEEIRGAGGQAEYVVADVADRMALAQAAETAERAFGGLDTWVNNAGVSIYGRLEDVTEEDARRLFETN